MSAYTLAEHSEPYHNEKKHEVEAEIVCPECDGERGYSTDHWNYSTDSHYTREHACEACKGSGSVNYHFDDNDSDLLKIVGMPHDICDFVRAAIAEEEAEEATA